MAKDFVRMCVDRVVSDHLIEKARAIAEARNPKNKPTTGQKLALASGKMWEPGATLCVRFLDGTEKLRARVQQYANRWTAFANLAFEFTDREDAEIRVSFAADPGQSWSAVGTDCLVEEYFPRHQPTMNFGWFDDDTE